MNTPWFYPNTVTQYAEVDQHVPWNGDNDFLNIKHADGTFLMLSRPLLHIANPTVNGIKMKTYFLKLTNFNIEIPFDNITGIEMELNMSRGGRIMDDTIQLVLGDDLIGENIVNPDLAPTKIYGSPTDMWGTTVTKANVHSPDFGVALRFRSHPEWPHREYAKIDYARLRFY